ncbi:MAG: hypothetical protein ABIJ09_18900 [Pseudomonadota bacterium]
MNNHGFTLRLGPLGLHLRGDLDPAELPLPARPFVDEPREDDLLVETQQFQDRARQSPKGSDALSWRGERRGDELAFAAHASPASPPLALATLRPVGATLHRRPEDSRQVEPAWFNPLLQVLTAHAAPRRQGLLLHAACVQLRGRAWLLAGSSGSGKSTLASALTRHGGHILADDRSLVFAGPQPVACGTPWGGEPALKRAGTIALGGILFVQHADEDALLPLSPVAASAQLLAVVLGLFWDRTLLDQAMALACGLGGAGLCWRFRATVSGRAPECLLSLCDRLEDRRVRQVTNEEAA